MFGRKMWLLLPPGRDLYSNLHPLKWSEASHRAHNLSDLSKAWPHSPTEGSPCVLEQLEGDVLYIPGQWSHQVLNLGESVGVAVEVHS